jgi:kinesin family protein 18/19
MEQPVNKKKTTEISISNFYLHNIGAGKTYTMLGTENNPGVMYRTLDNLFVEIKNFKGQREYQVSMSYLEIYNELIRDLLVPSSSFLELREDAKGTIQVAGLSEVIAKTPEEVMEMLHKGNRARTQEPTKANKTSSRSHAVLQVNIKQREVTRSHNEQVRFGKTNCFYLFKIMKTNFI